MTLSKNNVLTATDMTTTNAKIDAIQVDTGDPSTRTNYKTVEAMIGIPDSGSSSLDNLLRTGFNSGSISSGSAGSVMEMEKYIQAAIDAVQTDIGNPSIRTNYKSVETMLGTPDAGSSSLDNQIRTGFNSSSITSGSAGSVMEMEKYILSQTTLIDSGSTAGLAGVANSLSYRIHEIEKHFHSDERYWGKAGSATETNATAATLTPFVAVSGNNAYGAAIPICGSGDFPSSGSASDVKFDFHKIVITDNDHATPYRMRFIAGAAGGSAAAVTAGNYTETVFCIKSGSNEVGNPVTIQQPRISVGSVVWAQVWNATNASEVDFFWGCHGYPG